jgi:hypothetical protein
MNTDRHHNPFAQHAARVSRSIFPYLLQTPLGGAVTRRIYCTKWVNQRNIKVVSRGDLEKLLQSGAKRTWVCSYTAVANQNELE